MIGFIRGVVIETNVDSCVVYTQGGVGYFINKLAINSILLNESVEFFIYTNVKESEISLWGFKERLELELFKYLIGVSGVGVKTAMQIISKKGIVNIVNSIIHDDFESLKVSGVGDKIAKKILLDLKDRVKKDIELLNLVKDKSEKRAGDFNKDLIRESTLVLLELGYTQGEIKQAILNLQENNTEFINEKMTTKDLIKEILKFF